MPRAIDDRLGDQRDDHDARLLEARRMVADRCLYGVDIDEMAVELAKLSLWIVTLAKGRPFNFVDHALRCGDSLIGCLTSEQVEAFHLKPAEGRRLNHRLSGEIDKVTGPLLLRAAELRRQIEEHEVFDIRDAREKAAKLEEAEALTERLRLSADAVVGAKLSTASLKSADAYNDRLASIADLVEKALGGDVGAETAARKIIDGWLRGPRERPREAPLRPLHWPLEFPEIVADPRRGEHRFDAVVSNPPFIAGTDIGGRIGKDRLSYIGQVVANGFTSGGRADLCTYFLLRNLKIAPAQRTGIIAVNTIAQNDSKEVGLDRIAARGWRIFRATKSQPWPSVASVYVSLVWLGKQGTGEKIILDGKVVESISSNLTRPTRVPGAPHGLAANAGKAPNGYQVRSTFVIDAAQAHELFAADSKNRRVVLPYLINDNVNSNPNCSGDEFAIDFNDMSIDAAKEFPDVFSLLERRVQPSQDDRNRAASRWWQHHRRRPELRKAIAEFPRVLVIGRHSKYGLPCLVPNGQVYSDSLVVFCDPDQMGQLALLTSTWHFNWWTVKGESTLEDRLRYTPSDGFDTFAQPELTPRINMAGEALDDFRRKVQLDCDLGMTDLYNEVHNRINQDAAIQRLREIHVEIDEAVSEAYLLDPLAEHFNWTPLDLNYGFHETTHGLRWTIDPDIQVEMNDRLLELNHARYEDEVCRGLHSKGGKKNSGPQEDSLF